MRSWQYQEVAEPFVPPVRGGGSGLRRAPRWQYQEIAGPVVVPSAPSIPPLGWLPVFADVVLGPALPAEFQALAFDPTPIPTPTPSGSSGGSGGSIGWWRPGPDDEDEAPPEIEVEEFIDPEVEPPRPIRRRRRTRGRASTPAAKPRATPRARCLFCGNLSGVPRPGGIVCATCERKARIATAGSAAVRIARRLASDDPPGLLELVIAARSAAAAARTLGDAVRPLRCPAPGCGGALRGTPPRCARCGRRG